MTAIFHIGNLTDREEAPIKNRWNTMNMPSMMLTPPKFSRVRWPTHSILDVEAQGLEEKMLPIVDAILTAAFSWLTMILCSPLMIAIFPNSTIFQTKSSPFYMRSALVSNTLYWPLSKVRSKDVFLLP